MTRKILLSILSGFVILVVTWYYQNYDYTFSVEDAFFKKLSFWKYKTFTAQPKQVAQFVFVNTGKDPAIVEDSIDYGNVVVSDREKIYQFVRNINLLPIKPRFTVLDLQFYYPYTPNPGIDRQMQTELNKNNRIMITLVRDNEDNYLKPLYHTLYAYSDFRTFGSAFNKFRIMKVDEVPSIPILLHEKVDAAVYENNVLYATCNGKLCLSAIWPAYYLKDDELKSNKDVAYARYFNLGEMLFDMEANPEGYSSYFKDKIVIVGNFETDVHSTPVGKMAGSVVLANIYLSLLNKQHLVNLGFFITILVVFSALSYVAWFERMPELKFNFKFIFSSYLTKFLRTYISYFGAMFFLSLICLFVFNVQVALFLPAFIYSGIEYWRQKKYRNQN